jgi:hypothetical protein
MTAPRYRVRDRSFEARQWTPNVHESVGDVWLWLELRGLQPEIADGIGGSTAMHIGEPDADGARLRVPPGWWVLLDDLDGLVYVIDPDEFHHRYETTEG